MRRTSGQHAIVAAIGGGFIPERGTPVGGHELGHGTYRTRCVHADGRVISVITHGPGNGWQAGKVARIQRSGPWHEEIPVGDGRSFRDVRAWLNAHEPGREEPFCGGDPIPQVRPLDGREREILGRIIRDIFRAVDTGKGAEIQCLLDLEQWELYRLHEIRAVLDARD